MFRRMKDENDPKAPKTDAETPAAEDDAERDMGEASAPPLKPFSKRGAHTPGKPPTAPAGRPSIPNTPPKAATAVSTAAVPPRRYEHRYADTDGRKLIVGRQIELSGKITSCDKLVVEGYVEVDLDGARMIEIAPGGHFKGKADVEEADISGRFEGELIARKRLIVRASGQVGGDIRYAGIVIEPGGEVHGSIQVMGPDDDPVALPGPSSKE